MFKIYYEDIETGAVETYGSYAVTLDEVLDFASKYDPQPFHLDAEAAKKSVFGAICASGWHTCAMTMRMMVDHLMEQGLAGMGSPGVDEIKWQTPVFPGDILSVTTTVQSKRPSESKPHLGFVKSAAIVKNQRGTSVMSLITNYMILRRDAENGS